MKRKILNGYWIVYVPKHYGCSNPEFADFLVPKCVAHGGCNEFRPCGLHERTASRDE